MIQIRTACKKDQDVLIWLQKALAFETEWRKLSTNDVTIGVAKILDGCVPGEYIVAESEGNLIGCLMINPEWSDWSGKMQLWLNSVYIIPKFRNQGVFGLILNYVRERTTKDAIVRMKLYVHISNHNAIKAYESMGFSPQDYILFERAI